VGNREVPRDEDGLASGRPIAASALAFREWGTPEGSPVVFLHGLGPSGPGVVDDAAPVWADEYGFRVLAADLPGFGRAQPGDPVCALPSDLARIVERALDELEIATFALVGFSWGGTIGCRIDPRRLEALALLDVGYHSGNGEVPSIERRRAETADADFVEPEFAAAALYGVDVEPPTEMLGALADANVPVLLLVSNEPHVERRAADLARFKAVLPRAQVRTIEGAGHNLLADAPAETTRLVGEWLRSAVPAPH
jgi:pimeloyl-ACP methyl ester carboxylesterase